MPDRRPAQLARNLADAGADVIVGTHAHVPLGAGMLDDTYVSYGLGNFLWYNGGEPDTGVLRLQIVDGKVVRDEWVPGQIKPAGGRPRLLTGSARQRRDPGVARSARLHRPGAGTERRPTSGRSSSKPARSGCPRTPRPSSPFRVTSGGG